VSVAVEQRAGYGPETPVPIFQWEAEFSALLHLYRERQPSKVLEVGTYHGGTLYHWLQNARSGATVVSVDSYQAGVDNRHLYDSWKPYGIALRVIEGDSREDHIVDAVQFCGPYDWVFVDAGHYLHEVTSDWENYGSMCVPGGVVVFHDILPPSSDHPEIEVERLWREIQRQGFLTREIVHDVNASWGGIGICYIEGGS
jgi:predicted O-methyltransferase YrrM